MKKIQTAIEAGRGVPKGLIDDFFEDFLKSMDKFKITKENRDQDYDEVVCEKIDELLPLRDRFVEFSHTVLRHCNDFDPEQFHKFFEKLIAFTAPTKGMSSYQEWWFDSFKFFNYELTLYYVATLISMKKYKELLSFIDTPYFYSDINGNLSPKNINILNRYASALDEFRKNRLKSNRISITADLIKERSNSSYINFGDLIEADYIMAIATFARRSSQKFVNDIWFPRCIIFSREDATFPFIQRLASKAHFEKVKAIFNISNKDELATLDADIQSDHGHFEYSSDPFGNPKCISSIIELNKVASV